MKLSRDNVAWPSIFQLRLLLLPNNMMIHDDVDAGWSLFVVVESGIIFH